MYDEIKSQQRMIDKSRKGIEREKNKLQFQNKKDIEQIKKLALAGKHEEAKKLAQNINRQNNQIKNFDKISGQMKGMSSKVQQVNTYNKMGDAMESCSNALNFANQNINMDKIKMNSKNMMLQNEKLNMKGEMINDALDNIFNDEDEEETNEIYNNVLKEAGLDINAQLPNANQQNVNKYQQKNVDLNTFKSGDNELDNLLRQLQ